MQPPQTLPAGKLPARSGELTASDDGTLGVADLHALVDAARDLSGEVHMPRLLHRILEAATRLTDSPDGSVLLLDETRSGLYFADAVGASAPMLLEQWGRGGTKQVPSRRPSPADSEESVRVQISVSLKNEDDAQHQRSAPRRRQGARGAAAHKFDAVDRGGTAVASSCQVGLSFAWKAAPAGFQRAGRTGGGRRPAEQQGLAAGAGR